MPTQSAISPDSHHVAEARVETQGWGVEQDLATVALGTEPASLGVAYCSLREVTQPLVTSAFTVRVVSRFCLSCSGG